MEPPVQTTQAKERLFAGSILDEEIRLETRSVEEGVIRYRRMVEQATLRREGAGLKPAERMLVHWFQPMLCAVRAELRAIEKGEAGVGRAIFGPALKQIDAERITVVTIREMLSRCMAEPGGATVASLTRGIGEAIIAEIHTDRMRRHDSTARKTRKARIKTQRDAGVEPDLTSQEKYPEEVEILKELEFRFARSGPSRRNWWAKKKLDDPIVSRTLSVHMGNSLMWKLIGIASAADYDKPFRLAFRHSRPREGKRTTAMIKLDHRVISIIEDGHEVRELLRPRYLPMVVEPYPWTKGAQGGYIQIRTPFTSKPARAHKEALKSADLTETYECLSAVTSTPIRINGRVLDVQRELYKRGGGAMKIPFAENIPTVPHPEGYQRGAPLKERWMTVTKEQRDAFNAESKPIRAENRQRRAERFHFARVHTVADMFASVPKFWQPHQLCFRSRVYPIPQPLHHQGHDVCRGIIEFADSVPASERWLSIQTANTWGHGIDKKSFADRVAWVKENAFEIERTVRDPMQFEWWQQAKKPWQFLAACYAINDPSGAGRRLGVDQDGSANGLQHYTAMVRDETLAPLVNMTPAEQPSDIYSLVARQLHELVKGDHYANPEIVFAALQHCVREVTKPTTMTDTYGVTLVGARTQVRTQLEERGLEGEQLYKVSRYLSQKILATIETLCPRARAVMNWLRECAQIIADAGHMVSWTTQLGFPVVQAYRFTKSVRVQTSRGKINIVVDGEKTHIDVARQVDSIAPDFNHSVDATHMFMTARTCRAHGVQGLYTHDCYKTHSGTCDAMAVITRDEFVNVHRKPLLDDLYSQFVASFKVDLPKPPALGTFDLNLVPRAPYFFS